MTEPTQESPSGRQEAGEIARLLSYVAIFVVSAGLGLEAAAIPTSRFEVLGAGAFPLMVYGLLCVVSLIAIVGSVRRIGVGAITRFGGEVLRWIRDRHLVIVIFACFGAYLVSIPWLGFSIATFVFLLVAQLILAPRNPLSIALAVVIALLFSFGLNWVFGEVFNVFLPRGT